MPEHQKVQKISQKKYKASRTKRRNLQEIETDLSIQLPESTSDGRGCFTGGLVNGNGMRVFFVEKQKKRETARERTQEPSKNKLKGGKFRRSGRERSGRKRRSKRIRRKK